MKEIHDAVKQHYELINSAFTFYPTGTSADVFHMGLNNFTAMLEDCKVSMAHMFAQNVAAGFRPQRVCVCVENFPIFCVDHVPGSIC